MEFHTNTSHDTDIRISFCTDTDMDIRFSIIPIPKIHTDTNISCQNGSAWSSFKIANFCPKKAATYKNGIEF